MLQKIMSSLFLASLFLVSLACFAGDSTQVVPIATARAYKSTFILTSGKYDARCDPAGQAGAAMNCQYEASSTSCPVGFTPNVIVSPLEIFNYRDTDCFAKNGTYGLNLILDSTALTDKKPGYVINLTSAVVHYSNCSNQGHVVLSYTIYCTAD